MYGGQNYKQRCFERNASSESKEQHFAKSDGSEAATIGNIYGRETAVLYEWKIPDFFQMTKNYEKKYFESPTFSYSCSSWRFRLYLDDDAIRTTATLYLRMVDSETGDKNIVCTVGLRKPDGTLEETATKDSTFKKGDSTFGKCCRWDRDDLLARESELLLSDTVTVTCLLKDVDAASQQMKLAELETLSADFRDLLNSKAIHDVTIKLRDREFQAHRAVLAARSHVFAAMFEHDLSEKETGVVDVEDSDLESFGDFLQYLYTGRIEDITFRNAYHLYVTANKYDVKQLKLLCVTCMRRNLNVENFCDVAVMADQYDEASLMDSAQVFFNRKVCSILSTTDWDALMIKNHRLANRLFREMASAGGKE